MLLHASSPICYIIESNQLHINLCSSLRLEVVSWFETYTIWLTKIWVFSTDTVVSSSEGPFPQRRIKVMFKQSPEVLGDLEVIELDEDILEEVKKKLHDARKYIIGENKMGDWEIGYLPR